MNRREFLKAVGFGAASLALPGCSATSRPESSKLGPKPNIIIIMADDMGFSDIGCYGGEIDTPNIDRLAANGLRFTQFYNTARCCPTRASLLTGLYSHQTGVGHMTDNKGHPSYQGYLNDRCVTIAEALKPAGYSTYMAGKWHVCPINRNTCSSSKRHVWPRKRGFDRFYGTISGGGSYYNPQCLIRDDQIIQPESEHFHYTDAISDNAAAFVTEHFQSNPDKPFFMYVAYTSPHWPLHAPDEYIAKYKGKYDAGWDKLRAERHKRMIEMDLVDAKWPLSPRHRKVGPWERTKNHEWHARRMEVYAAQIDQMDNGIGRILAALEKENALDNTLILFLSDNGGCHEELFPKTWLDGIVDKHTRDGREVRIGNFPQIMPGPADTYASYGYPWANASNTPFRLFKHWVHEGGVATPLIAHYPTVITNRGRLTHQPGHVIDLMATCTDVAGAKYPREHNGRKIKPLEGKSLLPIFTAGKRKPHKAIFWEHEGNHAVRSGKYKLVSRHPGPWELYDLEADRTEVNNLAETLPEKTRQLHRLYNDWAERCGILPWPIERKR